MRSVTRFMCDFCHKTYNNELDAIACEHSHKELKGYTPEGTVVYYQPIYLREGEPILLEEKRNNSRDIIDHHDDLPDYIRAYRLIDKEDIYVRASKE